MSRRIKDISEWELEDWQDYYKFYKDVKCDNFDIKLWNEHKELVYNGLELPIHNYRYYKYEGNNGNLIYDANTSSWGFAIDFDN